MRGNALRAAGQNQAALTSYDQALALNPNYLAAHYNRANTLQDLERLQEALSGYEQALHLRADFLQALHNRANVLLKLKRYEQAVVGYTQALQLAPDDAQLLNNRSVARLALKDYVQALADSKRALILKPNDAQAHLNRARALQAQEQYELAMAGYEQATACNPNLLDAHYGHCFVALALRRNEQALRSCDAVLALNASHCDAWNHRGVALHHLRRFDESLRSFAQALVINPDCAQVYCNRGLVLQGLNRLDEAMADFDRARALQPQHDWANWNQALCRLLMGDFEQGWPQHEWRWQVDPYKNVRRHTPPLPWLGQESLQGKTILLHAEQGFGDTLQFCRYAQVLKSQGVRVLLEVHPPLIALMHRLAGVDQVINPHQPLPPFDYHCPLLSLPLACKTVLSTIPAPRAYLSADSQRVAIWQQKLGPKTQSRVGLVWSGNSKHQNDVNRSMALSDMAGLLSAPVQFFSLQAEVRAADQEVLQAHPQILDCAKALTDFSETAALIELLDLVISVDTSVAHLAAAMGKPTWLLLPYNPDWRWLMDRTDSPWYPSMRLFRQTVIGDWAGVVQAVRRELQLDF